MIERGEFPGDVIGLVVGRRGGRHQADILVTIARAESRVRGSNCTFFAVRQRAPSVRHEADADSIGQKAHVEQSALGSLYYADEVRQRHVAACRGLRMAPNRQMVAQADHRDAELMVRAGIFTPPSDTLLTKIHTMPQRRVISQKTGKVNGTTPSGWIARPAGAATWPAMTIVHVVDGKPTWICSASCRCSTGLAGDGVSLQTGRSSSDRSTSWARCPSSCRRPADWRGDLSGRCRWRRSVRSTSPFAEGGAAACVKIPRTRPAH